MFQNKLNFFIVIVATCFWIRTGLRTQALAFQRFSLLLVLWSFFVIFFFISFKLSFIQKFLHKVSQFPIQFTYFHIHKLSLTLSSLSLSLSLTCPHARTHARIQSVNKRNSMKTSEITFVMTLYSLLYLQNAWKKYERARERERKMIWNFFFCRLYEILLLFFSSLFCFGLRFHSFFSHCCYFVIIVLRAFSLLFPFFGVGKNKLNNSKNGYPKYVFICLHVYTIRSLSLSIHKQSHKMERKWQCKKYI